MANNVQQLEVLIASPGDATPARDVVERALQQWNTDRGRDEGVALLPRRWETGSVPYTGRGDAQTVINGQMVDDADIVIALFYFRLGSPTERAASGTAEEIERSVQAGKPVHIVFADMPVPQTADFEEFMALQKFRHLMNGVGLNSGFMDPSELPPLIYRIIESDLREFRKLSHKKQAELAASEMVPADEVKKSKDLPFYVRRLDTNQLQVRFPPTIRSQSSIRRGDDRIITVHNGGIKTIRHIVVRVHDWPIEGQSVALEGPVILEPNDMGNYKEAHNSPLIDIRRQSYVAVQVTWTEDGDERSGTFNVSNVPTS